MGNPIKTLRRNLDIRLSNPRQYVRERVYESAARLNQAGMMAARVELLNEALARVTELAYTLDADGHPANVDAITYRLRIPAPWGKAGYKHYGLREWEGEILNKILRHRQDTWKKGQRPPLYIYDPATRTWHINLPDYGSLPAASHWLKHSPIKLAEFRAMALAMPPARGKDGGKGSAVGG